MKKIMSTICAAAMLATTFSIPAMAGSVPSLRIAPTVQNSVQDAQYWDRRRGSERWDRSRDRWDRRGYRDRWDGPRHGWYRGHRGHRHYRPGYRRHDGFWFPPAAFITGAIVGGAIASQPAPRTRVRDYGSAHVDWCYDRYRSYRASDNTFQPYNGPRRQCRSPYY